MGKAKHLIPSTRVYNKGGVAESLKASYKEGKSIGNKAIQSLVDKVEKKHKELEKHRKQGYDGQGSTKRHSVQAGTIKWQTDTSRNKYPSWKRKEEKLKKEYTKLKAQATKALDKK